MKPAPRIFRQVALDRLSSPEQLDRMVTVSDGYGWLALWTVIMLFTALGVWSVVGSIPTNVQAEGILITRGGKVSDAMTPSSGTLQSIEVDVDDQVEKGQIVARIEQTINRQRLANAEEVVAEKRAELKELERDFDQEVTLKTANIKERRAALERVIAAAEQHEQYLERSLALQEESGRKGYISQQDIQKTRTDLSRVRQEIAVSRNSMLALEAEALDLLATRDQALTRAEQSINEALRQVRELEMLLQRETVVRAPVAGRVTEIKLFEGSVVRQGQAVASIEHAGQGLQAMLFVPIEHGKKLRSGMSVHIEPSTVKKEEHGSLLGKIDRVSDFPVSREGMAAVLQNDALVSAFADAGPPYTANVDLLASEDTPSGYQWTSAPGPPMSVSSGTTVSAEITVREQRPIDLVIPILKKTTGIY